METTFRAELKTLFFKIVYVYRYTQWTPLIVKISLSIKCYRKSILLVASIFYSCQLQLTPRLWSSTWACVRMSRAASLKVPTRQQKCTLDVRKDEKSLQWGPHGLSTRAPPTGLPSYSKSLPCRKGGPCCQLLWFFFRKGLKIWIFVW